MVARNTAQLPAEQHNASVVHAASCKQIVWYSLYVQQAWFFVGNIVSGSTINIKIFLRVLLLLTSRYMALVLLPRWFRPISLVAWHLFPETAERCAFAHGKNELKYRTLREM